MNELKQKRNFLRDENRKYDATMREISCTTPLAQLYPEKAPKKAWRSRFFLAQLYEQSAGVFRLSVNRTEIDSAGEWKDGITWDELQQVKTECGFGDRFAVEVYPPVQGVVNVANIRHLFLLTEKPHFAWGEEKCST